MPVSHTAHARRQWSNVRALTVSLSALLLAALSYSTTTSAQTAAPAKIILTPADPAKATAAEAAAAAAAAEAARVAAELERAARAREQCNKRNTAINECRKIEGWKGESCEKGAIAMYDLCTTAVAPIAPLAGSTPPADQTPAAPPSPAAAGKSASKPAR